MGNDALHRARSGLVGVIVGTMITGTSVLFGADLNITVLAILGGVAAVNLWLPDNKRS